MSRTDQTLTLIGAGDAPLAQTLSTWRSLDPPGVLPHLARALDGETAATESVSSGSTFRLSPPHF